MTMSADPESFLRVAKAIQLVLLAIAIIVTAGGAAVLFAFYRGPGQAGVLVGAGLMAIGAVVLIVIFGAVVRSIGR